MTRKELEEKVETLENELFDCREESDNNAQNAENEAIRADDAAGELDELQSGLRAFKSLLDEV